MSIFHFVGRNFVGIKPDSYYVSIRTPNRIGKELDEPVAISQASVCVSTSATARSYFNRSVSYTYVSFCRTNQSGALLFLFTCTTSSEVDWYRNKAQRSLSFVSVVACHRKVFGGVVWANKFQVADGLLSLFSFLGHCTRTNDK